MPGRCLNLKSLQLTNSKLRTLDIGLTPNLEDLVLENCYYLEELHMADRCQKLVNLDISHSKLRALDLGHTPNIEMLDLNEYCNLEELHIPIGCLENLVYFRLSGCLRFGSFLFNIWDHTSSMDNKSLKVGPLAELHLTAESLESCRLHPESNSPKYQFVCQYEQDRPSLTGNLEMLISLGMCACTNVKMFSESICGLRRLRKLKLEDSILEVPKDLGQLECLNDLTISSREIKHLPDTICILKHLKSLKVTHCWLLVKLPEDLGQLECLEKLDLSFTKIKRLPDSICMSKRLKSLKLYSCWNLEKLPEEFVRLDCLKKLDLSNTDFKHLPDHICMLKRLKSLKLDHCSLLEKLPQDLGRLECLENLSLKKCNFLQNIPNSICMMKCLKYFHLSNCIRVKKLPKGLGRLECLEELDIEGTRINYLPHSILLLKGLRIIGSTGLLESRGFTSEIRTLPSETLCYVRVPIVNKELL